MNHYHNRIIYTIQERKKKWKVNIKNLAKRSSPKCRKICFFAVSFSGKMAFPLKDMRMPAITGFIRTVSQLNSHQVPDLVLSFKLEI
uniref:Uncharacterized protein n=1 Tax=Octopus bimaculoides TaxID=37653 RepID=A0A0L8HJU3_OCTBM